MNTLRTIAKNFLMRVYSSPVLGNLAAFVTSVGVSFAVAKVPYVTEVAVFVLTHAGEMPEGFQPTPSAITALLTTFFTPFVLAFIKGAIQAVLMKDANKVLEVLSDAGVYQGKMDGWTGPDARESVNQILLKSSDRPPYDR